MVTSGLFSLDCEIGFVIVLKVQYESELHCLNQVLIDASSNLFL